MSEAVFKRAPNGQAWPKIGEWKRVVLDGKFTARLRCPDCGCLGLLDHEIDSAGAVSPSVECDQPDCKYHENRVVLLGWLDG